MEIEWCKIYSLPARGNLDRLNFTCVCIVVVVVVAVVVVVLSSSICRDFALV